MGESVFCPATTDVTLPHSLSRYPLVLGLAHFMELPEVTLSLSLGKVSVSEADYVLLPEHRRTYASSIVESRCAIFLKQWHKPHISYRQHTTQ